MRLRLSLIRAQPGHEAWLRKAILRASGYKPLRDEAAAFRRGRERAAAAPGSERAGLDWYAFTIAFKGLLLEGLEVAFIVVTFGNGQGRLGLAAAAAAAALIVVAVGWLLPIAVAVLLARSLRRATRSAD